MIGLENTYRKEIAPKLQEQLGLANPMQVPRLEKLCINMGVGEAINDKTAMEQALNDMRLISGQQPVVTKARKSVAGFKIRAGWPIGCKVTLRRARMYEFLERLIHVAIPRIRDFRGISDKVIDAQGNLSIGINEQLIFPEISYDDKEVIRGLDISIVTSTTNAAHTRALLAAFKFPFRGTDSN
jgi:large subunit ribosomal protein L5